jgi:predicted Zn-dependent protease
MIHRVRLLFASVVLVAGVTVGIQHVEAETLDLLGVGWDRSPGTVVTVLIKAAGGVTPQAILDVEGAVEDWNTVLRQVNGPELQLVSGVKKADITIQMKVGGGVTLGSAGSRTISPFACELSSASIQLSGKAFGAALSSTGTRNVARHEIGHALGLGHSDDEDDLMYPTFETQQVVDNIDRPISQCDKKGLEAIYPLPTTCNAIAIPDSISCP